MEEDSNKKKSTMDEDMTDDNWISLIETLQKEEQILWSNMENMTLLDSLTCKIETW